MLTQLNKEAFIDIKELDKHTFEVLVLKETGHYVKAGLPFQMKKYLYISDKLIIKKTKTLNKCFKIYQENSKVGVELFLKALDIDVLEILKSMTTVGFRPNKTKNT